MTSLLGVLGLGLVAVLATVPTGAVKVGQTCTGDWYWTRRGERMIQLSVSGCAALEGTDGSGADVWVDGRRVGTTVRWGDRVHSRLVWVQD